MNRTIGIMGMALVLACGSGQLLAQTETKTEKASEAAHRDGSKDLSAHLHDYPF
jgi:hypothetical protein